MRTRATPAESERQQASRRTPVGAELAATGFMTSTTRISPMPGAPGFVEKSGRMQAVPVPALAARISMAVQMFALVLVGRVVLDLYLYLQLLEGVPVVSISRLVVVLFRPFGRPPLQFNTSQLRHSSREWRVGMTIQTEILS